MSKEEIRRRHVNGADALMWGTDYPHPEGSWPHTAKRLESDFRDVSIEDTRLLLGLNAVECYNLDLDSLTEIAAPHRPHPRAAPPGPRPAHPARRQTHRPLVDRRVRLQTPVLRTVTPRMDRLYSLWPETEWTLAWSSATA